MPGRWDTSARVGHLAQRAVTSPQPYTLDVTLTGWISLAIFILLIAGSASYLVASDRRRKPFQVSYQQILATPSVAIDTPSGQNVEVASAAIHAIGGEDVSVSDDGLRVAGWIGKAMTNLPSRQQYQLLVDIHSTAVGCEFRCVVRPRFPGSLSGATRSGALDRSLREALTAQRSGDS